MPAVAAVSTDFFLLTSVTEDRLYDDNNTDLCAPSTGFTFDGACASVATAAGLVVSAALAGLMLLRSNHSSGGGAELSTASGFEASTGA